MARIKDPYLSFTLAAVYLPAQPHQREEWLSREIGHLNNHEGGLQVDIICGDWNMVYTTQDKTRDRLRYRTHLALVEEFISALGNQDVLYIDGWRIWNPHILDYIHKNYATRAQSRIDRILLREDWYQRSSNWDIAPVRFPTDHSICTVTLRYQDPKPERGPGRWRLNPLAMKQPSRVKISFELLKENLNTELDASQAGDKRPLST